MGKRVRHLICRIAECSLRIPWMMKMSGSGWLWVLFIEVRGQPERLWEGQVKLFEATVPV
jgi:hypothetical protein